MEFRTIFLILVSVTTALLVLGLISIAYNLVRDLMTITRRPLYWLALPMAACFLLVFLNFLDRTLLGVEFLPSSATRSTLVLAFLFLGLLLNLVPYVDRRERAQIERELDRTRMDREEFEQAVEDMRNGENRDS